VASNGQQVSTNVQTPNFKTSTLQVEAVVDDGQTVVVGGLSRDDAPTPKRACRSWRRCPVSAACSAPRTTAAAAPAADLVTASIQTPQNRHYAENPVQAHEDKAEEDAIQGRQVPVDLLNEWLGDPKK